MRIVRQIPYRSFALLVVCVLAAVGAFAGQDAGQIKEQADDAAALKKFTTSVDGYLTLRRSIEKKLPALKNKEELPEMIAAHQQALARKIREGRPNAKRGDIFSRDVREAFRHLIRNAFQDPGTAVAHSTVQVNGVYPDAVAETTFPSALLQKLPQLPEELAYRIVGHDLVLVDSKANLVVDLFHEALP